MITLARPKRPVNMRMLETFDAKNDTSLVRELEMAVDSITCSIDAAYGMQFWRDVALYNVREAYLYLSNFVDSKAPGRFHQELSTVRGKIEEIHSRVGV